MDENGSAITLDWASAKAHFDAVRQQHLNLYFRCHKGEDFILHTVFAPLKVRYEHGDRTQDLYNRLWSVE